MNALTELPDMQIMSVELMTARINAIQQVTRAKMIQDVHYGVIPGTQKPTLYKAGAEMLLTMFGIGPKVEIQDLSSGSRIKYRVIVTGIHIASDRTIGQGVGECSSGEEKYQWRNAICAEEFAVTPDDRKRVKWARGRNNSTYQTEQIRTNADDLSNTVLKMAKKRALIDMTLTALGVSDLFSQDIEDMPEELRGAADKGEGGATQSAVAAAAEHPQMKAAKTTQELAKVMTGLKTEDKKRYAAYFNQRMNELKGAST